MKSNSILAVLASVALKKKTCFLRFASTVEITRHKSLKNAVKNDCIFLVSNMSEQF